MKRLLAPILAMACLLGFSVNAGAQCMLANPSFEVLGSGGMTFAGWNQFGQVGLQSSAPHGARAARVIGPNTHAWDLSGYWQTLPCVPGQRWNASVCVSHSSLSPLSGGSQAVLNIEWRNGSGNLISYESHVAADASTPTDTWRVYSVQSGPAPAGTASIHFVIGVLQGPTDPLPQASFDIASCVNAGPPTLDSLQWGDFPSGRTLDFSGRTWRVKGTGYYGPGPNMFDGSSAGTWVDALGRLHLAIHKIASTWYSSEVTLVEPLGYGDYVFTTRGRLDQLDRNAVLGMFLWQYGPCYDAAYLWWNPYNEIDIEFSRWGSAANQNAQFVAQPAVTGNISRFNVTFADSEVTSHAMRWLPGRVDYRSWRGGPNAESPATTIASWTYTGAQLPLPDMPRVHLNLWQLAAPTVAQEVIFDAMTFRPACSLGDCGVLDVTPAPAPVPAAHLAPAAPNPFGTGTAIRYTLTAAGNVELTVYDTAGRRIRQLASGSAAAGPHVVEWDGRNDAGQRVQPGVYLYRLSTAGIAEAKRVVVLR